MAHGVVISYVMCKFDHVHDGRCPVGCSVVRHTAVKTTQHAARTAPRGTVSDVNAT